MIDQFLENGFRRFGPYVFRPKCPTCNKCVPLRIVVDQFLPSHSQKKILRRCKKLKFEVVESVNIPEAFAIWKKFNRERFNNDMEVDDYIYSVGYPSPVCRFSVIRNEYDKIIGLGFLDKTSKSLSSVYFVYDLNYSDYSLGHFSILKEIEWARMEKIAYYYLGYYISDLDSMSYKSQYRPHQLLIADEWK